VVHFSTSTFNFLMSQSSIIAFTVLYSAGLSADGTTVLGKYYYTSFPGHSTWPGNEAIPSLIPEPFELGM